MELFDALLASRFVSGFTPDEDQLAALNSGIDSSKVEQIGENAEQLGGLSFAKLCLYSSEDVRIDQNPDNYVAIFRNGGAAQDGVERTESLVYALLSKSQKGGVQYGAGYIGRPNGGAAADVIDIVFSVPANLPEVDSYSYITPVDPSEIYASRDPVGWTFQKSTDGGVTWTVLDTRSNVPNPGRGNETERFYIM